MTEIYITDSDLTGWGACSRKDGELMAYRDDLAAAHALAGALQSEQPKQRVAFDEKQLRKDLARRIEGIIRDDPVAWVWTVCVTKKPFYRYCNGWYCEKRRLVIVLQGVLFWRSVVLYRIDWMYYGRPQLEAANKILIRDRELWRVVRHLGELRIARLIKEKTK